MEFHERPQRFKILVARSHPGAMFFTLIHEWAHALSWNYLHASDRPVDVHGPEWGVAYALAWKSAIGEG